MSSLEDDKNELHRLVREMGFDSDWLTGRGIFTANKDVSNWRNITVENERVTGINWSYLAGVDFEGLSIPWHMLVKLTGLKTLNLSNNKLTYVNGINPINSQVFKLTCLEELDLSNMHFTGEISKEFGKLTQLKSLCLQNNKLTGEIPKKLSLLTGLEELNLSGNKLSDEMPKKSGHVATQKFLGKYRDKMVRLLILLIIF